MTPQEKKKLAYERDHYVSATESRHAHRKKWPKKKAMLNQAHRHRADQALHQLEKLVNLESIDNSPIEVTAEQLRKVDPRKKLHKWGVRSLREHVKRNQESRVSREKRARQERERIDATYRDLISALELDLQSPKAQKFLSDPFAGTNLNLRLFLRRNPDWKRRLYRKLAEVKKLAAKTKLKQEIREAQKQRVKKLRQAILSRNKIRERSSTLPGS